MLGALPEQPRHHGVAVLFDDLLLADPRQRPLLAAAVRAARLVAVALAERKQLVFPQRAVERGVERGDARRVDRLDLGHAV